MQSLNSPYIVCIESCRKTCAVTRPVQIAVRGMTSRLTINMPQEKIWKIGGGLQIFGIFSSGILIVLKSRKVT